MIRQPARIFSIPSGATFLDALVDALFSGPLKDLIDFAGDPLALAASTIHVPTRRAARALAAKLAERLGGATTLLPRIVPLGETDALEFDALAGTQGVADTAAAIGEMQRRLLLARLVGQWSSAIDRATLKLTEDESFTVASGAAGIMSLAGDLARLIDGMHLEAIPLDALMGIDAADYQKMWRISATFLAIAGEKWPAMLTERRRLDPADRHDRLVRAYAARLAREGSAHPVIAAGSTGSIAATAELLATIARLSNGAVVLPGLDLDLDERSWSLLDGESQNPSHPQFTLRRLLDRAGVPREEVQEIGMAPPALAARARLLTEAMRPAETTDAWGALVNSTPRAPTVANEASQGFEGIAVLEAPDERIEALAIALILREAAETQDQVAALITPDRGLAERVAIELSRWGITADDSAGIVLSRTPAGRLALILSEIAASGLEAETMIALLAHPAAHLGLDRATIERGAVAIEIALLRGQRAASDARALKAALVEAMGETPEHAARPRAQLGEDDFAAAAAVIDALGGALDAWSKLGGGGSAQLPVLTQAHETALSAIARRADGSSALVGPDAEALATLFADLAECADKGPELPTDTYPRALRALMDERAVTLPSPRHRRVKIWGLLEARLLKVDVAVLGALVEGTWPARITTDPFLNRGMRKQLGLSAPERRIGQMAHDFVAACGTKRCVLTRPLKADGAETIASRFLQRLEAVAGKELWKAAKARGARYLAFAEMLEAPGPLVSVKQPSPIVPAGLQPTRLSVTGVETLLRDPYAIFTRHVLALDPLDPVGLVFDPRLQGSIWHDALAAFVRAYPRELPADSYADLLRIGRHLFGAHLNEPQVEGFVWPRFKRAARWFVDWERQRRPALDGIAVETRSQLLLPLEDGQAFRLTARPDRVERMKDGRLAIVDFKTGTPPSQRDVLCGFSPQLTFEAAILAAGGMPDMPPGEISELVHVALSGGTEPGKAITVKLKDSGFASMDALAAHHLAGLRAVLNAYRAQRRGFTSKPFPANAPASRDYDHLARVAEWSDEGGEEAAAE